jgi:protein arginine kinase
MKESLMNEKNRNKNSPLLSHDNPWVNNANSIWLGSTITLFRNLERFKFPGKLSADKRKQIISLLSRDMLSSEVLKQPKLIKAEEMPPIEKEFLVEHFLANQGFHQAHIGEAFILDESGEFLATLNLRDHLVLQWIDCREELEAAWDRLVKIETNLTKSVNFAFLSRFGFLTSDPTQCGTGLLVHVYLHLPALAYTNQLADTIKKYKDDGIEQTGLQGDPQEIIGDITVFHNNYTLGLTEENILTSLRTLTTKLIVEEKSARSHLKQENTSEMKDKVSRAYAILLHSYQIEAVEALNAISLVKLGLDLGWLTNTSHKALNELFFSCRRAHLLCHYREKINQEEIPHKRAEFIHQSLKGVTLHI